MLITEIIQDNYDQTTGPTNIRNNLGRKSSGNSFDDAEELFPTRKDPVQHIPNTQQFLLQTGSYVQNTGPVLVAVTGIPL